MSECTAEEQDVPELPDFVRMHAAYRVKRWEEPGEYGPLVMEQREFVPIDEAHIISSRSTSGLHRPVLDLDLNAALLPSTTPGHFHLYIDKEMSWWRYKRLLKALVKAGVIERGYYEASRKRGHTAVRLPWIKKVLASDVG